MSDIERWQGASGASYDYTILDLDGQANISYGTYIFARRNPTGGWDALYVGQGDLSSRADVSRHDKRDFILGLGATHVHIHENSSLPGRMIERADILYAHPEAYPAWH